MPVPDRWWRHQYVSYGLTAIVGALTVASVLMATTQAGAQMYRRPPDPQELEGPRRAPITITPFLTVEEEFDDNVFLNNDNKEWDFITRFTPGISIELERAQYRLAAAYTSTLGTPVSTGPSTVTASCWTACTGWRATPSWNRTTIASTCRASRCPSPSRTAWPTGRHWSPPTTSSASDPTSRVFSTGGTPLANDVDQIRVSGKAP